MNSPLKDAVVPRITSTAAVVHGLARGLGEGLVGVVLFGSRARGDASAESDWDLLVVAGGLPSSELRRQVTLKRLIPREMRGAVSIMSMSLAEFEKCLSSVFLDIALDGKVLFDRGGVVVERLESIRTMIRGVGLRRVRTPMGDTWLWKENPGRAWVLETGIRS
jgi:predicted nucleotidyltransferase